MIEDAEKTFDIIYEGFIEYRKIQGYPCPSRIDIEDWEVFKAYIFNKLEERYNNGSKNK